MKKYFNFLMVVILLQGAVSGLLIRAENAHAENNIPGSAAGTPYYSIVSCMFDLPIGITEEDIECGYLTVPLYYEGTGETIKTDGAPLQLAVARLRSRLPNSGDVPLFMAQGGPGGSTIDVFLQQVLISPLYGTREIVLFDQRGTLYSKPFLDCPELLDLTIQTLDKDLSVAESIKMSNEASLACRERLSEQGIDLSAFNSLENAGDVDALRKALGYEQIDLYGVSYGTFLALQTVRSYPQSLRAVILDAVVPPQVNFITTAPQTTNRAFEALFTACEQQDSCRTSYPNLRAYFYQLVDRLTKSPVTFYLQDSATGKNYQTLMNGDFLQSVLFQMIYSTELIPFLPKMIWDAGHGKYNLIQQIMPMVIFDRTMSNGMYYSVTCAENSDFTPQQIDLSGLPPQLSKDAITEAEGFINLCNSWNVQDLTTQVDQVITSEVPTLILNGQFDPITPAYFGELVAKTLKNSTVFTFPNTGHGSAFSSGCSIQIVSDFLSNPSSSPDGSCIQQLPPVKFHTSNDVMELPVVYRILNLNGNVLTELSVYGVSTLILVSALFIYPAAWLIRVIRRRPVEESSVTSRLATWFAALNGFLTGFFSLALIILFFVIILDKQNLFILGVPRSSTPLFIFPWLVALTTLGMAYLAIGLWQNDYGSLRRRIYFTVLTIAALCVTYFLISWGMITVLFG